MNNIPLWKLIQETHQTIVPTYKPVIDRYIAEMGWDHQAVSWLMAALTFEPETISAVRLQVRGPYTAVASYQAKLDDLANKDFLAEVKHREYRLTMRGEIEIIRLLKDVQAAMAEGDPLPLTDSQHLASLLERLVHASLDEPSPPDKWSIGLAYKLMPAASPPLPYSEQAISCLAGYRDDAHLAAWQSSGLSAPAMETLTLLWRRDADSAEAVFQRLHHRGHPHRVYLHALEELRARGFVKCKHDHIQLTESGQSFRQQVEDKTNRYFFTPWDCLNPNVKNDLANLLTRLRDGMAIVA